MGKIKICALTALFFAFCTAIFAENDSVNFRGKREPKETGEFCLLEVKSSRLDSDFVQVELFFNQTVDPQSVSSATYFINQKKIKPAANAEFSRDGKKVRLKFNITDSSINFEVQGIKSYNGKELKKGSL